LRRRKLNDYTEATMHLAVVKTKKPMSFRDYAEREYLSATEAAKYLNVPVATLHTLAGASKIPVQLAASGQMRFSLKDLKKHSVGKTLHAKKRRALASVTQLALGNTTQTVIAKSAASMHDLPDESVNLMITSPPYFNAKMYSGEPIAGDLGNVHDIDQWFNDIAQVWRETFRVLQSGRKIFINIMNLPIRIKGGRYRTLNLVGRTIEECEKIGFIFKRDIIWHKTNGVRAHFGTYPYPGGILINTMHEFILEFDKPEGKRRGKYAHVSAAQKAASKLDKEFWLLLKNSDVWHIKPQASGDKRKHIAPFPYELPYRLVKAFSYEGEAVLDPFVGSGTTLFACADLKRNGVGYEINPDIATDAIRALAQHHID
jgi:modification methylase